MDFGETHLQQCLNKCEREYYRQCDDHDDDAQSGGGGCHLPHHHRLFKYAGHGSIIIHGSFIQQQKLTLLVTRSIRYNIQYSGEWRRVDSSSTWYQVDRYVQANVLKTETESLADFIYYYRISSE